MNSLFLKNGKQVQQFKITNKDLFGKCCFIKVPVQESACLVRPKDIECTRPL